MKNPLFSIIIPTYNRAEHLSKVIRQLLAKQGNNFELVIVDDGTDNTKQLLDAFDNSCIRYFHRPQKMGVSSARNLGVEKATGEYVIFFDDDDEVSDTWLADFEYSIMKEHADIVLCGMKRIDHLNNTVQDVYPENRYNDDKKWGIFLPGAFAVKKDIFIKAGGYDEVVLYGENTELAIRIRATVRSYSFVHKLNYIYIPSLDGGSKNLTNKVNSNVYVLEKHKHYFDNNLVTKKHYAYTTAFAAAHLGNLKLARKLLRQAILVNGFNLKMCMEYLLMSNRLTARMKWKIVD